MNKILVLGGYGNLGKRIAGALLNARLSVIIAGRSYKKAKMLYDTIKNGYGEARLDFAVFDCKNNISLAIKKYKPNIVIDASGSFNNKDYSIIENCLENNCHYIDLANDLEFVNGIKKFDNLARERNLSIISGASLSPCLTSAVISKFKGEFVKINKLKYGISIGTGNEIGLASVAGILNQIGKKIKHNSLGQYNNYGWQDLYRQDFPKIGKSWMANSEVADLGIFPKYYDIDDVRFYVGLDNGFINFGLYFLSWLVRFKLISNLSKHSKLLAKICDYFCKWGSSQGGAFVEISGLDSNLKERKIHWYLIAKDGDGPYIPTAGAVLLAKKIALSECKFKGASACLELIELDEYLEELRNYQIKDYEVKYEQKYSHTENIRLLLASQ